MQALLVKIEHQVYALPSSEVVRSIQITKDRINSSGNKPVIVVDDQQVFLIDLRTLFHINKEQDVEKKSSDDSVCTIVLVHHGMGMLGCRVDKIISDEEILVKQLGPLLKNQSRYFSGATILADGSAAPIINLEGLV